jgi:hypothetical protein
VAISFGPNTSFKSKHKVPINPAKSIMMIGQGSLCFRLLMIIDDLMLKMYTVFIEPPNGVRYPLVGGARERFFIGTSFKPHKLPENAATPTSPVHAVLGTVALIHDEIYQSSQVKYGCVGGVSS